MLLTAMMLVSQISLAGEILNRSTGESIRLDIDTTSKIITITSTTVGLPEKINLDEVRDTSNYVEANYFSVTKKWVNNQLFDGEWSLAYFPLLLPTFVVTIGSNVIDILIAPVQGVTVSLKNSAIRKDFITLLRAINTDGTQKVNQKRYIRISNLLKR